MKTKLLFTALCIALPLSMMAQDDDDMYFVPKKKDKKERKSEEAKAERPDFVRYEEAVTDAEPAPDYHVGALRSDDEYNRRGRYGGSNYGEVRVGNDTVYVVEEEAQAPSVTEEDDYAYSGRLVRFYGGVLSPFYWDYYYDWAFYDPWFYSPWHVGFHYGPYGWYGGWYHHGWYDPWYDPWHHGCWGWVSHHPVGGTEGSRFGGRRGLSGLSAGRGSRGDVASAGRGNRFDYTRGSMSASRTGRATAERASATRGTRFGEGSSRTQGILGRSTTSSTQRTQRSTATQRSTTTQRSTSGSRSERSYTPSRSYSSGSVSSGSFGGGGSRGGGSFGGGRGGGGRGGR